MNLRDSKWYALMNVSGIGKPITASGTVISIMAELMRELQSINPRELRDGKSVTIRLADNPIDPTSKSAQVEDDAWAQIEINPNESQTPLPDETYDGYLSRLIGDGMQPTAAKFFADDWFNQMQDVQTLRLMNDSKAQRFILLNASKTEFANALPSEYEELKKYFIKEYPERAEQITFRTA